MGARPSDQAWLRSGHNQDGTNCVGWCEELEAQLGAAVPQGDLHTGCLSCGREVVGVGPSLPRRRK